MQRAAWAMLCWVLTAGPAAAGLEIRDLQASYGPLGPEREQLEVYPNDELWLRFQVHGAHINESGKMDISQTWTLTDTTGKVVASQTQPVQPNLALGNQSFPGFVRLALGGKVPPGDYSVSLAIKDNLANATATVERRFTCKPTAFAAVGLQFYYDAEGKIPAPAGGVVGQALHFRLRVIGFDPAQGKIDTAMYVQLLDARNMDLLSKSQPFLARKDGDDVRKATHLNFNGQLGLNRPGEFTLRIAVHDRLSKLKTSLEVPLKVTAP